VDQIRERRQFRTDLPDKIIVWNVSAVRGGFAQLPSSTNKIKHKWEKLHRVSDIFHDSVAWTTAI